MSSATVEEQSSAAVLPETEQPRRKPMPGWAVLLHNDDVNEINFVVRSVVDFARLTVEEAMERTVEAHSAGIALLVVTHRERAELIQEQFQTRGLTVTIEPAA